MLGKKDSGYNMDEVMIIIYMCAEEVLLGNVMGFQKYIIYMAKIRQKRIKTIMQPIGLS